MTSKDFIENNLNKITDWKNEPSFDDLYSDYKEAQNDHNDLINKLDEYKLYMDGGPKKKVARGRSSVRPKLIRKQAEWKYPALEEPFLNTENMFRIKPRTFEDKKSAEQNELVLNYQWSTKIDKVSLVGNIVRGIVDEGTVVVKTGWEVEESEVEYEDIETVYASPEESIKLINQYVAEGKLSNDQVSSIIASGKPIPTGSKPVTKTKTILTKNNPTYQVCNLRDLTIDPTCNGDIHDAQFIIHEYDTDMSTLKEQEYKCEYDDEGNIVSETGIYKNLDKIKLEDYNEDIQAEHYDYDEQRKEFKFKDKPRQKLRAYEYWGYWDIEGTGKVKPIVATWVGSVIIRLEENPFPFDELPFSLAKYMPRKNEIYGEPDGSLLKENQESIGNMMRAAHDITSTQAVGQEFIDEQFLSPLQQNNYKTGKTVFFRHGMDPRTAIHRTTVDPVPRAIFDMISYHQNDAESMTGTKSFSQGIGSQSLGSVAAGIRSAMDSTAKRELSILRRLSEQIFKDIARKTIMMNQAFLDEKEVIRITNEEFVTIKREDLAGEFDLIVDVSTPEKDNEKAEKLNMLMQTNAASMDPELSKIIYARIAKLWKEPDLAKEVENYQPQPDPMQQQLQKIQLENAMLENQKLKMEIAKSAKMIESEDSKIEERASRTAQNLNSETEENKAEARLKNAQARLIESQADHEDLKFVKNIDGTSRKEKVEDSILSMAHKTELEQMKLQHKRELEELKALVKAKENQVKHLVDIKKSTSSEENKQTIASVRAQELGDKSLDRLSNMNGDYYNARI